jgi:hypothetical protein
MNTNIRWALVLTFCAGAAYVLQLGRKRRLHARHEHRAHKASLHEWENEGGNLAPAQPLNTVVVGRSAHAALG